MKYLTEDYSNKLSSWFSVWKGWSSALYIDKAGYFDERPQIHTGWTQLIIMVILPFLIYQSLWFILLLPFIQFGYGNLVIKLPIHTGIQDCDSAAWGFNYHGNTFWIYIGGGGNFEGGKKWKTITMPWSYEWYRTSLLAKDYTKWYHNIKGSKVRFEFYMEEWKEKRYQLEYEYTDSYDDTIIPCVIHIEEMEWRMKWLMWTSLFNKVRKSIEVEFSKEVGKEKGSWKGGCIGCGYNMLPNETPLECIQRMERDRKF